MTEYRHMQPDEREAVLELAYAAFDEAVAPDFSPQGIVEFRHAARSFILDEPDGHVLHVAIDDGRIVGMIDIRDESHVCLFFVDSAMQGRGVGRGLFSAASTQARAAGSNPCALTVNAAPSAVGVYERLGFVATAREQEKDGIRYVAMRWIAE